MGARILGRLWLELVVGGKERECFFPDAFIVLQSGAENENRYFKILNN